MHGQPVKTATYYPDTMSYYGTLADGSIYRVTKATLVGYAASKTSLPKAVHYAALRQAKKTEVACKIAEKEGMLEALLERAVVLQDEIKQLKELVNDKDKIF